MSVGQKDNHPPKYRRSKRDISLKSVYSIEGESRFLICSAIPALNLQQELVSIFSEFGDISESKLLDDHPDADELFDVILIQFSNIDYSRTAKLKINKKSFYGSHLVVRYAPEFETIDDVRDKLENRRQHVLRLGSIYYSASPLSPLPTAAWIRDEYRERYATAIPASLKPHDSVKYYSSQLQQNQCQSQEPSRSASLIREKLKRKRESER